MTSLAVFGLVCVGIGALAATVGLWTAGMFRAAAVVEPEPVVEEWPFPQAPYDREHDDEAVA